MCQKFGAMLEVDGLEGNGMGALDGVPYWMVCAEVPRNVLL